MKRRTMLAVAASALALTMGAPQAQTKYKDEYKVSTVVGTAFPWGKGAEIWIDLVKQRTNGRINMKLYPGVSLVQGDQTREFTAIRQGIIDMAVGSTINWSPQVKELNLFSLPFLMPDYKAIDALTQGDVGKQLFGILERQGVVPLAWGENGYRELTNSKREVRKPDDLKGLKIRVVGSPLFLDTFRALGANPTQMSWADAQPAFASGAVDGQENPMSIFTAAKLHTVGQKYVTTVGLRRRPADLRRQQGSLGELDAGRPRDRAAGRHRRRQAADRHRARRPRRARPVDREERAGARRQRHHPDAAGARRLRHGHAPRLRAVEGDDRRRPRQQGGRRHRRPQVSSRSTRNAAPVCRGGVSFLLGARRSFG